MNISVQKLLAKIEDQLKEAKASGSEATIRERVYAIKSLCELVLEQEGGKSSNVTYSQPVQQPVLIQPSPVPMQQMQPVQQMQQMQTPKLNTDEGNGDSLFDF
ncbi:YwdI family protein [Niallia taxi]|uniref:YwdI family protein n=1 Tax=Niallia taxi TaxID=2499688 RepID=UPI002E250523|nr:YwdI family protein [Niallia taxi]